MAARIPLTRSSGFAPLAWRALVLAAACASIGCAARGGVGYQIRVNERAEQHVGMLAPPRDYRPSELPSPAEPRAQETPVWCWAAVGEVVLRAYGLDVTQCEQARRRFAASSCPCAACAQTVPAGGVCVQTGWPDLQSFNLEFRRTSGRALSLAELRVEFDAGRPVPFAWKWPNQDGGPQTGHMMVAVDYRHFDGKDQILIFDPSPTCIGDVEWITYDWFVEGEYWTHWDDFYDIRPAGDLAGSSGE